MLLRTMTLILVLTTVVGSAEAQIDLLAEPQRLVGRYGSLYEAEHIESGLAVRLWREGAKTDQEVKALGRAFEKAQEHFPIVELHSTKPLANLEFLKSLPNLCLLNLGGAEFERKHVGQLENLPLLRVLWISGWHWDAEAMTELGKVKGLVAIRAQSAQIEWAAFPSLPNLEDLDLSHSNFDDKGAVALKGCEKLIRISATRTPLTDKGLLALGDIESLKALRITIVHGGKDGGITEEALHQFGKKRPDVKVTVHRPEEIKTGRDPEKPLPKVPNDRKHVL